MPNAIHFEVHAPTRARPAPRGTVTSRRTAERPTPQGLRLSRILVATDGTAASDGAMIVAGLLARRHNATVDVVSVLPRWGQSPPEREFLDITAELLEERLAAVIPQGKRAIGDATAPWTIKVIDSSSTVDSIAETARREGHDLIITGNTRRGGWITRWLRRPTGLAVAQRSDVPVLVVPQWASALPTRAVVSVQGTDVDPHAAATLAAVLADDAAIHLVHVDSAADPGTREHDGAESGVEWAAKFAALERSVADLGVAGMTGVTGVVLRGGEPAARLVSYAEGISADVIVAGTDRRTIADRVSGDAGGRVLRAADRFVLLNGTHNGRRSRHAS
jgi:nucleotide-binding universal stress UspA family protein